MLLIILLLHRGAGLLLKEVNTKQSRIIPVAPINTTRPDRGGCIAIATGWTTPCERPGKVVSPQVDPVGFFSGPIINSDVTGQLAWILLFKTSCYECTLGGLLCPLYLWQCSFLAKPGWMRKDWYRGPPLAMKIGNCAKQGNLAGGVWQNNGVDAISPQVVSHTMNFIDFPDQRVHRRFKSESAQVVKHIRDQNAWCGNTNPALLLPVTGSNTNFFLSYCPMCAGVNALFATGCHLGSAGLADMDAAAKHLKSIILGGCPALCAMYEVLDQNAESCLSWTYDQFGFYKKSISDPITDPDRGSDPGYIERLTSNQLPISSATN